MSNARFGAHTVMAFTATSNPKRARSFYRDVLGLHLVSEDPYALVFDAHGTMLRVQIVNEVAAADYTVLGWTVPDIVAAATRLREAGVRLQRYAGMGQDRQGIWTSPSGARIGWFKDPDGNTLSITQF